MIGALMLMPFGQFPRYQPLDHARRTEAYISGWWAAKARSNGAVAELKAAGCTEKISGAKADRKQLARAIARLDAGDVLVVTRLDRLARSTRDLLNVLGTVADKGAGFRSLRDSWADTTTPHGRLMLTVLGGLAEFERELIRSRTGEGRQRAKARGVVMGRRPKLTPHQRAEALARRDAGETLVDIARSYDVTPQHH
jgi:DNA invertase Pin-like site-specific DNA recombinase